MARPAYGPAWQRFRLRALQAYGDTCWICGHPGATSVDHLDPVRWNGPAVPDISRVRPAHIGCNARRGQHTRRRRDGRPRINSREW